MAAENLGEWVLSDGNIKDRHGTVIDIASMKIDDFIKNPVINLHHDQRKPVGYCENIRKEGNKLLATLHIDPEASTDAAEAYRLIKAGALRAMSIEFIGQCAKGICRGVELICAALVSVPSNPGSLLQRSADDTARLITIQQPLDDTSMTDTATPEAPKTTERNVISETPSSAAVHTREKQPYNITRAMAAVAQQRNLDGLEAEVDQEYRHLQKWRNFSSASLVVPEQVFGIGTRANSALSGENLAPLTGEQHLTQLFSKVGSAVENELLSERVGAKVITGLTESSVLIPRQTDKLTASHVGLDADLTDAGDAPFDNVELKPRKVGALNTLNLSSILAMHPAVGNDFIANALGSALAEEVSRAFVSGDNGTTAAEPDGLISLSTNTSQTLVPATNAIATFDAIKQSFINYAGINAPAALWLIRHELLDALKTEPAFTGSSDSVASALGIPSGMLSGYPVMPTTAIPASVATPGYFGAMSTMIHGIWRGVEVTVNPWASAVFAKGGTLIRVTMLHDIGAVDPNLIRRFSADLS